ncbi:2745_t:CDS:2, partial [Funneliformis geosporum]
MLTFGDFNMQQSLPLAGRTLCWFSMLQNKLLRKDESRAIHALYPYPNNCHYDFSLPNKNYRHNTPFVDKLLKTEEHYAHILHMLPTNGADNRTLLSDCARCSMHDNQAYVPKQTTYKDPK